MKMQTTKIKEPKADFILRIVAYVVSVLWLMALFLPFYWLMSSSFKDQAAIYQNPPQWIPALPKAYTIELNYEAPEWTEYGAEAFKQDATVMAWMGFDYFKTMNLSKLVIQAKVEGTIQDSVELNLRTYKKERSKLWPILMLNETQGRKSIEPALSLMSFNTKTSLKPAAASETNGEAFGEIKKMYDRELPQLGEKIGLVSVRSSVSNIFDNYYTAWNWEIRGAESMGFFTFLKNSLLVATFGIALQWLFSASAAYAMSRMLQRRAANLFTLFFLGTLMIPGVVTMIPLYLMIDRLGLMNTLWAVIIPAIPSAFNIYLFKGFFDALPGELFDASRVDGAGELRTFANLVIPLSKPVFGVIALFTFLNTWNEFFWPYLVLKTADQWTFPIIINGLLNSGSVGGKVDYPVALSMSVIASIPMIVIFAFFQKYLSKGLVWSGIKG